jgi:hypothetical protein
VAEWLRCQASNLVTRVRLPLSAPSAANLTGQRTRLLPWAISVRSGGGARAGNANRESRRAQTSSFAGSSPAPRTRFRVGRRRPQQASEVCPRWFDPSPGSHADARGSRLRLRTADGPVRPRVSAPCPRSQWQEARPEAAGSARSSRAGDTQAAKHGCGPALVKQAVRLDTEWRLTVGGRGTGRPARLWTESFQVRVLGAQHMPS